MEARSAERARRYASTIASLHADQVAAEVYPALQRSEIRAILLKGPSIAAWLYADGTPRPYQDVDLLVEAKSIDAASRTLRELGFRRGRPDWKEVAWCWRRGEDEAAVDLHRGLVGAGAAYGVLWQELADHTDVISVAGVEIEVLSRPALAFHIALHAAKHGDRSAKPLRDLSRAVEQADEDVWRRAAGIAQRTGSMPAFAAGLRLDTGGAALAETLELPTERPLEVALQLNRQPALVLGLEHLVSDNSVRGRIRFVARKLAPPPAELRRRSALARRGPAGLCLAYVWRPLSALALLPGALLARRKARRENALTAR
jgi:hypothetical protein